MSNQGSISLEQNDEICMSAGIKFDTERMTWVCTETGLICDQDIRENSHIADIKTARQNSNNLIDGPGERKTDTKAESIVSSTTSEKLLDPCIISVHKNDNVETTNTLGECVETEANHPNVFDMGRDIEHKTQAVSVKNGVVKTDITDAEAYHFSDFEENPKSGLFWKLSEFYRRSGKQGLETRFELLSPTIIVDCSSSSRGSDEHEEEIISSSVVVDQSDTGDKASSAAETVGHTHTSETSQTNFSKDQVIVHALADSVSELEREDNTKIRCLRKRKSVEYYPKVYGQLSKTEIESDKNKIHSHTVLDWYKETAKMIKECKELDSKIEDSDPAKVCKRKRINKSCKTLRLHKFVRVGHNADYLLYDKSSELDSLPSKSLVFCAASADNKETAEGFVVNDVNKTEHDLRDKVHLVEHLQGISTHNNMKEVDFEIDSILQELSPKHRYDPGNAVELKTPCEDNEVLSETVDNETKEISSGADSSFLSLSFCLVNEEEYSPKVPVNNNEVFNSLRAVNACTVDDSIEGVRKISVPEKETELTDTYSGPAANSQLQYEEVSGGDINNDVISERVLRKGLRHVPPVIYFPNRKSRGDSQDRETIVIRNKKESATKLSSKTNTVLDLSRSAQTDNPNILSGKVETVEEVTYYETENCNKENCGNAYTCNNGHSVMENQTKPNDLSMESSTGVSEGQLDCVPLKQNNLEKTGDSKVYKALPKKMNSSGGQKHKRNKKYSNDRLKRCSSARSKVRKYNSKRHSLNPFNEVTNIHTEPFSLSNVLVKDSEKPLSDLLQSDFIAQKRVLRNRSPVSYFPDKKQRKHAVKQQYGKNQAYMRNKEISKSVLSEKVKKGRSFIPEIVGDSGSSVPHSQVSDIQPKPVDLNNFIPDYGCETENASQYGHTLKTVNSYVHTSDRDKQDILDNPQDILDYPQISAMPVADQNEAQHSGLAESVSHPGIEEEKAANVHSALVGLYAAEIVKDRKNTALITGADYTSSKTECEPDKFRRACQNVSDDGIGVIAEETSSEVEIGDIIDPDELNCSVNTKESDLELNSVESIHGDVTDKLVICTGVSKIIAVSAHTDGSVESTIPSAANNEPAGIENFALPSVLTEESETSLQAEPVHVEGTETRGNDYLDEGQPLTEQRISSGYRKMGNVQNMQIGNVSTTKETASCKVYPVGTVVWGRFSKTRWWPAIVVDGKMLKRETRPGRSWVMWLSDSKVSELKNNLIELFTSQYKQRTEGKQTESMKIGILKALQICAERAELVLSSFQSVEEWGQSPSGFMQLASSVDDTDLFPPADASPLPSYVLEQLGIIKKSLLSDNTRVAVLDESRVNDPDDNSMSCRDDSRVVVPDQMAWKRNKAKGKKIQAFDCEDSDVKICLSCDLPLRDDYQVFQHPLFEGFLCNKCKDDMMSSFYAIDDDGCSLFCCICSEGGKLFVCEKELCGRAYCFTCVDRHSEHDLVDQISQTNPWLCFLCTSYNVLTHGSLIPRKDWPLEIVKFFQTDNTPLCNDLDYLTAENKRKIRVLSLYDGIGTGKVVLNELGLDVEVYYASEVNKEAMLVSSVHHDVTHVGDASLLTRAQLIKMCPIDLVIGGPPCNDLSIVNPLRKGFNGTGMFLMKFIYILKDVEALCKGRNHVFWLLENTGSMLTDFKQVVCSLLRMEPAIWDAKYFTGQRRARCFWGNIPGLYSTPEFCKQLQQEKKDLDAALIPNCNRKALVSHTRTITTGTNSLTITNGGEDMPIEMNGVEDRIWVSELERLFGFPDHYTDVGHLSPTVRHKLLGKAWCVPVIKHILSPLKNYFALKET